ncbi:MAG: zinc-ribbon domain-containing protein [Longimicrobiales bacterium]
MNIACPACSTLYRVDPDRIPSAGVKARCRECGTAFHVSDALGPTPPGEFVVAPGTDTAPAPAGAVQEPEAGVEPDAGVQPEGTGGPEAAGEPETEPVTEEPTAASSPARDEAPVFGPQDPNTRARRLARALVSDIKVYHPEKWKESTEAGTLRGDFRDEILKSWEEYVEQVGEEMAKKTPYFRDALNEILARGERVF